MGMTIVQGTQEYLRSTAGKLKEMRGGLLAVREMLPASEEEVSPNDLRIDKDPDPQTEIRAVIGCAVQDCLDPLIRDLLAAADYEPSTEPQGDSGMLGSVV